MTRFAPSRWSWIFLALLALSLPSASASAGAGSGFGDSGTLYSWAQAILPLPDGDIVFANTDRDAVYVWRVAPDGAARRSSGRRLKCPAEACLDSVSLAHDSRQRVVVAYGPRVTRMLRSGAIDVAFGDRGTIVLPSGLRQSALAATSSDALLVGGGYALLRIGPDGLLDASFGDRGVVAVPSGVGDILVQPDGKIVVGGGKVMRYTGMGGVDMTYGDAGIAATQRLRVSAIALQADGKVVAAGLITDESPYRAAVLRVGSDGRLDPTFGIGGVSARWPPSRGGGDWIGAVGVQPGGGIVVSGMGGDYKQTAWFVHRLRPDGTSVGTPRAVTGVDDPERDCWGDYMSALAVQRDGKVLTSGSTCFDSRVVRYLSDLSRDEGRELELSRVPNRVRPASMQRKGKAWVASLRVDVDYPAEVTVTVRKEGRRRLPLLSGSTAGKTVLRRTARSVTATRSSAGAFAICVLVPAGAVRAGGEYSFVVEAADRRDRTAELWVTLVTR